MIKKNAPDKLTSVERGEDTDANDPRRSSYGRDYWLRRCEHFTVETPNRRIGRVTGIRYSETTNAPEILEVRTRLLGRRRLLISIHQITELDPQQRRLILADPQQPSPH